MPPSEATPVISKLQLVKAIQLRLYAIVTSLSPRAVQSSVLKLKALTIEEEIALSKHTITPHPTRICCVQCCASISKSDKSVVRHFLQSPCVAIPRPRSRPIALGMCKVQLGKQIAHASHALCVYRGLTFCNKCGFRAVVKYHNLAKPCVAPTACGLQTKHATKEGKLPPNLLSWPDASR